MTNRRIAKAYRRLHRQVVGEYQAPVRGRVTAQSQTANQYFADIEVLTAEGQPDPNWPLIKGVEVPRMMWAGGSTGVFVKLNEGARVRVGFYGGDRHDPYIDAVLGSDDSPDISGIEFLIKANGATVTVAPGAITSAAGVVTMVAALVEEITQEVINAASVQVVPDRVTASASAPQSGDASSVVIDPSTVTAAAKQKFTAQAPECDVLGFVHLGGAEPGAPAAEKILLGKLWEKFFNNHTHTCPLFTNSGKPTVPHSGDQVFSDKVVADK